LKLFDASMEKRTIFSFVYIINLAQTFSFFALKRSIFALNYLVFLCRFMNSDLLLQCIKQNSSFLRAQIAYVIRFRVVLGYKRNKHSFLDGFPHFVRDYVFSRH
jgi:hypothetical protein